MINLPCNVASMSQVTPGQNIPVQTSQYNFPACQQQTSTHQMQTAACAPRSGVSQGAFLYQPDTYVVTHQYTPGVSQPVTKPCHPVFQSACNTAPAHPICGQLSQNVLDQIRACVNNASPIFILPGGCQQGGSQQQQLPSVPPQMMVPPIPPMLPTTSYPPSGLTYPATCFPPPLQPPLQPPPPPPPPPPSFYPYPVPLPFCDSFLRRETSARDDCGCCRKRGIEPAEMRSMARTGAYRYDTELVDEHRCTSTTDDTICSKRNCPSSLHLQALASQFLSMQGIIPCAATRLVLRKVPGSNVTTTMEDTMAKAQKAINILTKDQLLAESRNAQQVNALINLHMTANPPPNIIPILTLVQLKMNLLKAQVEGLVNQKLMEIQGVGVEVEIDLIDPAVLALKSDAELRDFLSVLRQKECDERVNVNFAPYRSQRAIAETRLINVQNKIRQIEAELDRRRCLMLPAPTLSSRIVQQFSRPCYSARFEDSRRLYSTVLPAVSRSPDPFVCMKPRSPKRLLLKPRTGNPETPAQAAPPTAATSNPNPKTTADDGGSAKDKSATAQFPERRRSDTENCACCCDTTSSEESVGQAKKKLRPRIGQLDAGMTSNVERPGHEASSLTKLMSNVCVRLAAEKCGMNVRKCEEWNETSGQGTLCKRYMATMCVNITDVESTRILAESESETITLGGRIDRDIRRETWDMIEESLDRTLDEKEIASWPNLRQAKEEETLVETDESVKTRDIAIRGVSPPKVEQEEATAIVAKEQSDEAKAMLRSKKKTRFQIVSLMTNIVYNKKQEYRNTWGISNKTAKSKREIKTTSDLSIEKLDKRSLMKDVLKSAIKKCGRDITEKEDVFLNRLVLPKFHIDRPCQTVMKLGKEDKKVSTTLLRMNIFPPFKHLRKCTMDNKRKRDNTGTCPSPITKAGITTAKSSSCCNDITEDIPETFRKNDAFDCLDFECEEGFISKMLSLISKLVTLVHRFITLNGRLLRPSGNAILRKSMSIDILRKDASMHDDSQKVISKTYNHPTSESKHDRDKSLFPRISTGEGHGKIRKIRHSIIEDSKNDARYLSIGTSNHNLTQDFGPPYKVQKSLLIRSRLKNSANSRDHPHPFSLLKRARIGMLEDDEAKCKKNMKMISERRVLKDGEEFWTLAEVMKADGNNGSISETRKYSNESKEQVPHGRSHDDAAHNDASAAVQRRRLINDSVANNKLVTNVRDYSRLQTEISTSVRKFITDEIDPVRKIHSAHSY